jgi:phage gp29-like protein
MADITPPNKDELAPPEASAFHMSGPFMQPLSNPDQVLQTRLGGNIDTYREVLRDDQVKSTFQQRRLAVISAEWQVEPGADDAQSKAAAEALKANLDALQFDKITDQQLFAIFFGYGVAEILWGVDEENGLISIAGIKVRERGRFRFGIDGTLFLKSITGEYVPMPDRKFWTISTGSDHSDNHYGTGLAHWLYWPVYFKRADIKFWLIFLEKFGAPTAIGKAPAGIANDKDERTRLLNALRAISTESAVVVPEGCEITLLEAARSGAATYEQMHGVMNGAISKIVLSQTMTTDDGSSRSQSETHAGVRDMVVTADSDLVCESFNRGPALWWFEYNMAKWPGAKPPQVWRITEPPEDLSERADRDSKIISLGYEPTEDYMKETYGPGWVKKKAPEVPPAGSNPLLHNMGDDANFADPMFVAALKAGNRQDQNQLVEMAYRYANDYQNVVGQRVQQLLDYAEESQDFETFRKHLLAMLEEGPKQQAVGKVQQATLFSRLLGALRAQR